MVDISPQTTASYLGDGTNFSYFLQPLEVLPEIQPQTTSDTSKFMFTLSPNLYIDTKTVQLQLLIKADATTLKGCNLLLDGSSQSMIEELKIESNANQLELIQYYDIAANQLEHMGVSKNSKAHRRYFGFVPECYKPNYYDIYGKNQYTQYDRFQDAAGGQATGDYSCVGFLPCEIVPRQAANPPAVNIGSITYHEDGWAMGSNINAQGPSPGTYQGTPIGYFSSVYSTNGTVANTQLEGGGQITLPLFSLSNTGTVTGQNNVLYPRIYRGYNNTDFGGVFTAGSTALPNAAYWAKFVRHRVEALDQILSGNYGIQSPLARPLVSHTDRVNRVLQYNYSTNVLQADKNHSRLGTVDTMDRGYQNNRHLWDPRETCVFYGYQTMSGELISKGGKCMSLSGEHATHYMYKGALTTKPVYSQYIKLLVPLQSAIMGQMNQKFMPGSSIGRMIIYVTFNRNAFYLSGISNQWDGQMITTNTQLSMAQVPRYWQITSATLMMNTYRYGEAQNVQLQQRLEPGLLNNNLSVYSGGSYTVSNTLQLNSNWNITARIPSIRMISMAIYSNDYQNYTYCRKMSRLSGNITKLRLRLNEGYLPLDGIKGHSGNPDPFDSTGVDNTNFVTWIHQSLNRMYNNEDECMFSKENFAINDRAYPPDIINYTADPLQSESLEGCKHLWYGQTSLFEQNYFGMALYLWVFGQKPIMPLANVGLDSRNLDIFQVEISVDTSTTGNTRPQTLLFLIYADLIFRTYQRQIVVMGK